MAVPIPEDRLNLRAAAADVLNVGPSSASATTAVPTQPAVVLVAAADVAAPSEFAAVLRCYIPECEESERTGRFTKLNMALRGGPPYRDAEGARSWWAW
jgi:hypothetical protein